MDNKQLNNKRRVSALYHYSVWEDKPRIDFFRTIILGLLLLVVGWVWFPTLSYSSDGYLTVKFLNVGQGDAIYIRTPDGYEMLVDGGPSGAVLGELSAGRSFFDRTLDVVVATHPDADHITGLIDVLKQYEVDLLLESGSQGDSPVAVAFERAVDEEIIGGGKAVSVQAGEEVWLGEQTIVQVLSPRGDTSRWETNTASVVVRVVYGEVAFMLTGDAPSGIEEYLAGTVGAGLQSQVLKLGHHGSDTSSSAVFLSAVLPTYAVVSAGKDNSYGHPKPAVLERAREAGALIVSTVDRGTITFQSDGREVWLVE